MKRKMNGFTLLLIGLVFSATCSDNAFARKFNDKGFQFFEWQNPTPRFSQLGFNLEEVSEIVGDTQLLISNKGKNIDLWTSDNHGGGEIKSYQNARFVTSITILNKSRKEVIDFFINFDRYSDIMAQFTESEILKTEKNQYLVRLKQVYKVTILTLSADFRYLYTREDNGDLSILLLDGDVGAGVARVEAIAIDENRTMVVSTAWLDLDSARFVYRTIIKAQPDIKPTAPIGAAAMLQEQFRDAIENNDRRIPENDCGLRKSPDIPIYASGSISVNTLRRLSDLGTLIFVHPRQWIKTENGPKSIEFVSAAGQIPGEIEKTKPYSADFPRITEYFNQAKKITHRELNDIIEIDWKFKFGFGIVGVGIDYTINAIWENENTVTFEGVKGDIDPLYGAFEWLDINNGNTLAIFTTAVQISDDASWLLKLGNKVPRINIICSIFMGTLMVEKQADWIYAQLHQSDDLAVH